MENDEMDQSSWFPLLITIGLIIGATFLILMFFMIKQKPQKQRHYQLHKQKQRQHQLHKKQLQQQNKRQYYKRSVLLTKAKKQITGIKGKSLSQRDHLKKDIVSQIDKIQTKKDFTIMDKSKLDRAYQQLQQLYPKSR